MADKSLKARYAWHLRGFVALNAIVVFIAFSGSEVVSTLRLGRWTQLIELKTVLSLALPLATLILNGVVTSEWKAFVVYWRRTHILPGHRVFTEHGPGDGRVDMQVLRSMYGPLPTEPKAQNQLWYKLSKNTEGQASVLEAHYAWLLTRDLTNLSFMLVLLSAILGAMLRVGGWEWIALVGSQALLYLLLSQVAANKGVRFVTTVLAEASAAPGNRRAADRPSG